MKCCLSCGETQPIDNFNRNRSRADGRAQVCRPCDRKRIKEWKDRPGNRERLAKCEAKRRAAPKLPPAKERFSREQIEAAVSASLSMKDAVRLLSGKIDNGSGKNSSDYRAVRRLIHQYKINTDHHQPHLGCAVKHRPLEDYLSIGVDVASSRLRERLIKKGLLTEKCTECGIGPEWNGKVLVLQLHHHNGDRLDQRLANLRLLCPNCHTQTDNFGSKNRRYLASEFAA